jgi:hypothetical protein
MTAGCDRVLIASEPPRHRRLGQLAALVSARATH